MPTLAQELHPLTVAEESEFKSTSRSAEVIAFVDSCSQRSQHVDRFVFGRTVEGREMLGVAISRAPYELGQHDGRVVSLLIGNIHSGECAGKEALLMLIRDLADNPNHKWLDNTVLVIVPNYNADANDRVSKLNRPNQIGPENGMGQRGNAQGLDLNRDFVKLESAEAQNLVRLIQQVDPHLFVDCHTTNGSQHQYALTYDVPHNPASSPLVRSFLRDKVMPAVSTNMKKKGWLTFYYGNFNRGHTAWTTYGYDPRYSTEYVGMRGRLSVLSEAYAYISYRERIFASRDFASALLDYVHEHAEQVMNVCRDSDRLLAESASQPERVEISLAAEIVAFDDKYTLKGYIDGDRKSGSPHDYQCDFYGHCESTRSTPMAYAYLVPSKHAPIAERLLMHGVQVEQLVVGGTVTAQIDRIVSLERSRQAFQKHHVVRAESERREIDMDLGQLAGAYIVRTSQPLGRLATYLLEPTSSDGLLFWNFFDEDIEVGRDYPIVRIRHPVKLETEPVHAIGKN